MKKILYLVVIINLPLLLGASAKPDLNISGVSGKLLENIQSRLIELNQSKPLANETDEALRQQIAQAMQPYGYFKPQISLSRQPLQIKIHPGPQMLISNLHLSLKGEGVRNVEIKKAIAHLAIAKGEPFNSANYEDAKRSLITAAERQGYLHSSFDKAEVLIDTVSYSVRINLSFNTGRQYYFGQVQFDPSYLSPDLLRRYLPFRYGEPYSADQMITLNNQLADSGYFRSIAIKPQSSSKTGYIPLNIHLQPANRTRYSVGAGYGTDTGIRGRLGYHLVPVNAAGHKLNTFAIASFGQSKVQAEYIIPGKNPVTDEYPITGNLSILDYKAGYSKSALVSFAQHHSLSQYQRTLSINGLYEGYHYQGRPSEENFTFFPKASLTWLKTEDKLFAPSGYSLTVSGLGASKLLASPVNFAQGSLNAKAALTIPEIRTRFYFHTLQAVTQMKDIHRLPLSLAPLLGGAENLKAYRFNSIGPGKILSYGGIEIQKEFIKKWYFLGFLDSGDVYLPKRRDLKNDLGLGLMWVSPIGPIKMGIAQGLDSHFNRQEKTPRFVMSMGPDL